MSVSASLADLGSIASSRATQPPALRSSRTVSGQDDAFGQMLRDAAKEKPEAPARDANRLAARPRAEEARAEDRPAREKPEAPAAAVEHRSENARQGSGPRDPDEVRCNDGPTDKDRSACGPAADSQGSAEDAAGMDRTPLDAKPAQPVAETTETPAEQPVTTAADQTSVDQATIGQTTTAEALQLVAAGPSTELAKPSADPAAPVEAASPQEPGTAAPGQATTAQTPQTVLPAAPAVLTAGQASTPAQETTSAIAETPAITSATAKPSAISGQEKLPTPGEPVAHSGAKDEPVLPEKAAEAVAAARLKQSAQQPGENGNALGHARHAGEAEQAPAAAPGAPAAPQGQPAATQLDALRAAVAESQPQSNAPAAPGLVQAASPAALTEARGLQPAQAPLRHEMPVPLQAVAIEIGMRAMRGAKEFAIRLDPEDLGRIDVKLEVSDEGQVQARVVVEKVETLQLLQRDARTLERAFDQAGLKTSPDGLQFSLRDSGGQGRNGDDQPNRRRGPGGRESDEPMIDEIRLQPAQYRLASNGGLDIRI